MITIVASTNRVNSNTLKVAKYYQNQLNKKGLQTTLFDLRELPSDFIANDLYQDKSEAFLKIQDLITKTTKFLFIIPEYNGSFPGVLKAMIDNTDIEKVWWGKKALLTGVSTGRAGNLRSMEHLTGVLQYLKMHVHHNKLPISVVNKLLNGEDYIGDMATLKSINDQLEEFIRF